MSRKYQVNGEAMIYVRFGTHISSIQDATPKVPFTYELGLCEDPIEIEIVTKHIVTPSGDVRVEDAEAFLRFNLIHYDQRVLTTCLAESLGGCEPDHLNPNLKKMLGGDIPLGEYGNHLTTLMISSPVANTPHTFSATYFTSPTLYSVGTKRSVVSCRVHAILYRNVSHLIPSLLHHLPLKIGVV